MTPTIRNESALGKASRSAGRAFAGLLRGLLGRKNLSKVRDSARVLKEEFEAGKQEGGQEPESEAPKRVEHRVVRPDDPPAEEG